MGILDILELISQWIGLDFGSLLAAAAGITIVVNFLKATEPFSKWVTGKVVPYVTAGIALAVSIGTFWGNVWWQILVGAALMAVLSIGGWATAKMLMHKVGKEPTSRAGGLK